MNISPVTRESAAVEATREDLNALKAQERELAHRVEVNESLHRLKLEYTALQKRIRVAEMQAREVNGNK